MQWDYYKRIALNYLREPERLRYEAVSARRRHEVKRARLSPLPSEPSAGELPVCVSLTSYGQRIGRVHLAIRSIMLQTIRPNRVILWLGSDSNDVLLPRRLLKLQEYGLTIRRNMEDLRGHKKYYFAMQELEDCLLVTIDDDLIYAPDTIQSLLFAHARLPQCVVARRTHRIAVQGDELAPYDAWQREFREPVPVPRRSLVATTGAGTLYPPHTFSQLVGDAGQIRAHCLNADDLWMKAMEAKAHIPVAYAPNDLPMPYILPFTQESLLARDNVAGGGNDRAMRELLELFSLTTRDFVDDDAAVDATQHESAGTR